MLGRLVPVFALVWVAVLTSASPSTLLVPFNRLHTDDGVLSQLAIRLPEPRPLLFVFPEAATTRHTNFVEFRAEAARRFGGPCRFERESKDASESLYEYLGGGAAVAASRESELERGNVHFGGVTRRLRCARATLELREVEFVPHSHKPELTFEALTDPELITRSRQFWERLRATKREYPFRPVDCMGDGVTEALAWAWQFVTHHWGTLHKFNTWKEVGSNGIFEFDSAAPVRMAIAADWGSGTRESAYTAEMMMRGFNPHYTIHLGDIYLVGTTDEVKSNVLGVPPPNAEKGVTWPHGSRGSFALAGNHEAYSRRGVGYYDTFLPTLGIREGTKKELSGQHASYFSLENKYWRVISLDTGFNTYSVLPGAGSSNNTQPEAVIEWLKNEIHLSSVNDTRGIMILSHHQYVSAFDNPSTATPKQIAELMPPNRTFVWLFGHEHRFAVYNLTNSDDLPLYCYSRCLGVGGFPVSLDPLPPRARQSGLAVYDDRIYTTVEGGLLGSNRTVGFNGFSWLTFDGPTVTLEHRSLALDPNGELSSTNTTALVREEFTVDPATGNVDWSLFEVLNSNLTVVKSE